MKEQAELQEQIRMKEITTTIFDDYEEQIEPKKEEVTGQRKEGINSDKKVSDSNGLTLVNLSELKTPAVINMDVSPLVIKHSNDSSRDLDNFLSPNIILNRADQSKTDTLPKNNKRKSNNFSSPKLSLSIKKSSNPVFEIKPI